MAWGGGWLDGWRWRRSSAEHVVRGQGRGFVLILVIIWWLGLGWFWKWLAGGWCAETTLNERFAKRANERLLCPFY